MSSITTSKEFTVTVNGKPVTAEVEVCLVYDANYGADADGNRGIGTWFFDYIEPTVDPSEWTEDDNGDPLTEEERQLAAKLIEKEAENYDNWTDYAD